MLLHLSSLGRHSNPRSTFPAGCFESGILQADICNCMTVHLQKAQKVGGQYYSARGEHVNKLSISNTCGVKEKVLTKSLYNVQWDDQSPSTKHEAKGIQVCLESWDILTSKKVEVFYS